MYKFITLRTTFIHSPTEHVQEHMHACCESHGWGDHNEHTHLNDKQDKEVGVGNPQKLLKQIQR